MHSGCHAVSHSANPAGASPRERWVKLTAPHSGHSRNASVCWFSAEIDATSLLSSDRSMVLGDATENMEIVRLRRLAADLGTRQV